MTRRTITRDWVAVPLLTEGRYRLLGGAFETETVRALARPEGSQWVELATLEMTP